MAVVNQYKFFGVTSTAAETATMLSPLISETIIIKSLHITNKSASNTPTITITNNAFQVINTQTLATAASVEILTNPMVVIVIVGVLDAALLVTCRDLTM